MSSPYFKQLSILVKRLSLIYLVYFFCRLLFFAANRSFFDSVSVFGFIEDAFYGLRFDTFSIIISNCLFILLSLLPLKAFWTGTYQLILKVLFIITNTIFIAFNFIDIPYFPFIKKRSTAEIFHQMGGQTDMGLMIPQFLKDFWWVFLLFALFVYLILVLYKRIKWKYDLEARSTSSIKNWLLFFLCACAAVIGARGGLQRVPIDIVNAGSMTRAEEVPIVINTPFSIIKSFTQKALTELNYFPGSELKQIYSPIHQFQSKRFKKENVVVLILESFSKEYTKLGKTISLTPFLDSLMNHGLVFSNGFSNGTKSIEGIPAILSSMPSLMPDPLINSLYANNEQSSLARILRSEGYNTSFFHGGINGTMNFDDWAALAGYEHYYGRDEYDNDADFDGFWGIYDEPFLKWTSKKISSFKEPFHSAIFTLSSHHPYYIPEKYRGKLKKTELENSESISYADHSLREFFRAAAGTKWYKNTLFVLVADHTGLSDHPFFKQIVGVSSIPILFYKSDNSLKGEEPRAFSQIDILPSVLDLLGYQKKFFAFGESFREPKYGNDLLYINGNHYLFQDSTAARFNLPELNAVFNYKRDSTLQKNILNEDPARDSLLSRNFRAFIQTYNSTLIKNSGGLKQD